MKVGIMQPYFLPYLGYWQLMNAVDKYVINNDMNFIKGGWINRNRILINGEAHTISLRLHGASPNKLLNEVNVSRDDFFRGKLFRTIVQFQRKAQPYASLH